MGIDIHSGPKQEESFTPHDEPSIPFHTLLHSAWFDLYMHCCIFKQFDTRRYLTACGEIGNVSNRYWYM